MANLNIRDVEQYMLVQIKIAAAREGITMKDYVLRAVNRAIKESKASGIIPPMRKTLAEARATNG